MNSKAAPILILSLLLFGTALPASAQALGLRTVVIDPGHGGKDPGSISPDKKNYEKTLVLEICREFARKVGEQCPDVKVILTRDKDVFVPLGDRAAIATRAEANLFISVHVDAVPKRPAANGFSAFILGPSQKYDTYDFNMEVCKRENSVIYLEEDYSTRYGDFDSSTPESQIMLQLMANAFREQSLSFAETVSERMGKCGSFQRSMGVRQDNFQVLRQASMPAVLLEFGFITNSGDLGALRDASRRSKMVDALVDAFREYKAMYDASVALPSAGSDHQEAPAPEKTAPAAGQAAASAAQAAPVPEAASAAQAPVPQTAPVQAPAAAGSSAQSAPSGQAQARQDNAPGETSAPVATEGSAAPIPEAGPAQGSESPSEAAAEEGVYYGTQILSSSRLLFKTDSFFKGNDVKVEKSGDQYKYIAGFSSDRSEAVKNHECLKAIFPDSFRVRVDKNGISRF